MFIFFEHVLVLIIFVQAISTASILPFSYSESILLFFMHQFVNNDQLIMYIIEVVLIYLYFIFHIFISFFIAFELD